MCFIFYGTLTRRWGAEQHVTPLVSVSNANSVFAARGRSCLLSLPDHMSVKTGSHPQRWAQLLTKGAPTAWNGQPGRTLLYCSSPGSPKAPLCSGSKIPHTVSLPKPDAPCLPRWLCCVSWLAIVLQQELRAAIPFCERCILKWSIRTGAGHHVGQGEHRLKVGSVSFPALSTCSLLHTNWGHTHC